MVRKKKLVEYEEYFARQTVMKEFGRGGQKRLSRSKVAVVGVGGLGSISSLYLTLAGVGYLRLIDQDTVEISNLHRQVLYSFNDLHYPKVEVAAGRLEKTNPFVKVEPISENLNSSNVEELLSGVDCVVDGLDNMQTRYLVNRLCVRNRIPYVFGAAVGLEGNLSVFVPPETPCLECVLPGVADDFLSTCEVRGVLGATAGIIGAMQAVETIKVLAGMGSSLQGKLMVCDFNDMYITTVDILRRAGCPACAGKEMHADAKERMVRLCGQDTVNVNPDRPLSTNFSRVYEIVKHHFKVRIRSKLAIIFEYKNFEISLFSSGRMLIKNIKDEKSALNVYREIRKKIETG